MLFGNPQHQIKNVRPIGPVVWEILPPKLWEFRQKLARLPTFEPSYLRNEWPNIHKTGIDGQAISQGFQICHVVGVVKFPGKKHYVTFEWPLKNKNLSEPAIKLPIYTTTE